MIFINSTSLHIPAIDPFDVLSVANIFQTSSLEALHLGIMRLINKGDIDP